MRPPRQVGHRPSRFSASGTSIAAGFIDDQDNNTSLVGAKWYGERGELGIAGKMMRDAHVRQSIAYVTDPLRNANWRFRPASKDPLHVEQADFLTWAFIESMAWDQFVKRAVTGYCADGFALFEMLDDIGAAPAARFPLLPSGGAALLPRALLEIPANTVDRWYPRRGKPTELEAIEQFAPFNDVEQHGFRRVSSDRIIRFTYDQQGANFTGLSVLRSAFGPWKCKLAFLGFESVKHERTAVGTPVVIFGEQVQDAEIDAAAKTLEQMRVNAKGYAVFQNGVKFEWVGATQSDGTNINEAIERCNKDIAINVSAGFMLLGLTGTTGSYALGATQQSQYHQSTVGHAKFFGQTMVLGCDGWSPVRRILEANYGAVDALPTLEARNLPTRNWLDVMPSLINATNAGLVTPDEKLEDEVREIFQVRAADPATARAAKTPGAIVSPKKDAEPEQDNDDNEEPTDDEQ
jgi:hypothetical protein